MVLDTLDKLSFYEALNPLFKDIVSFLVNNDLRMMEEGKHLIKGDDLFVNITTAKGKTPEEAKMETHRRMLDIQIPLDKAETFGYTPLSRLPEVPYDEEKDISKYDVQGEIFFTCHPGEMVIFWPQDGHQPCISDQPSFKKAIFKVKI